MLIGVPKEIKPQENRVGLTPESVKELIDDGNEVIIERTAGQGSGFDDQNYKDVGATVFENAQDIFDRAELIIKVKEPQDDEIKKLKDGQLLFTYLHLAASKALTEGLMNSGATCIAYETITDNNGRLPCLLYTSPSPRDRG